ncbi:MAG TPA: hypothetical protein VL383_09325 [Gemmatimonadaceae bacterium]|jgi:hypothetical protein|nr:hypothetical protein [Gemmatimonadaceae bacterium]
MRCHHKRTLIAVAALLVAAVVPAGAQRPDTVARTSVAPPDSLKPPITPRRAFLYSFVAPGYSQSILGRHKAAMAFLFVEAVSIAMIRESAADVHEARRTANDTIVVAYGPGGSPPTTATPRFSGAEVRTREAHVEDWVALLVANHLFAGADAFVAAHLWDVPAHLGFRVLPGGAAVSASLKW